MMVFDWRTMICSCKNRFWLDLVSGFPLQYIGMAMWGKKRGDFAFKTRNCVSKTRNCTFKTRKFVFKNDDFCRGNAELTEKTGNLATIKMAKIGKLAKLLKLVRCDFMAKFQKIMNFNSKNRTEQASKSWATELSKLTTKSTKLTKLCYENMDCALKSDGSMLKVMESFHRLSKTVKIFQRYQDDVSHSEDFLPIMMAILSGWRKPFEGFPSQSCCPHNVLPVMMAILCDVSANFYWKWPILGTFFFRNRVHFNRNSQ